MHSGPSLLFLTTVLLTAAVHAQSPAPARPAPAPAAVTGYRPTLLEHETDPHSLRKSKLDPALRWKGQVLRFDVNGDGKPDIIETWVNGHRERWFDENGDMTDHDVRGDMVADRVQIDRDDDGYYDGPHDIDIKWGDDNGDGVADLQVFVQHPGVPTATLKSQPLYMVFFDVDHDGVNGYIDWKKLYIDCWKVASPTNYLPDYNGNSMFLKEHSAPEAFTDPRHMWENPFAFYDYDGDGCTEMGIRVTDEGGHSATTAGPAGFTGQAETVSVAYDLDNDSQRGNEMDYDMSLRFSSEIRGEKLDFSRMVQKHPGLKAPAWVLPYFRVTNWMTIDELVYPEHAEVPKLVFQPKWGSCWMVFDEDDDDHRWERVELYYPYNPYSTARWKRVRIPNRQEADPASMSGHPQADSLGDRGEFDTDFSGGGKLYLAPFDHKIHLYGAEWGAWTVDEGGKYWGAQPNVHAASEKTAPKVGEVVQYRDTDNNGYFDEITYDYDGDGKVDLKISLLDYADREHPHPDVAPLVSPGKAGWAGLHSLFTQAAEESFRDALVLYRAAWRAGLTDTELDDLAFASSTWEKYDHGYWLKEKLFRRLDRRLRTDPARQKELRRAYFTGDYPAVARVISTTPALQAAGSAER